MKDFCNAQTFAHNYSNDEKIPKDLRKLMIFTSLSKFDRDVCSKVSSRIIANNNNDEKGYIFNYNGKEYPFSVFSDYELQKFDKKTLESVKRLGETTLRSLKLACSMDLVNPRIVIGNSLAGTFDLLIMFQENETDKVIDYTRNLVMNKDDYYEIFKYQELNIVDKSDLYNIYHLINIFGDCSHLYEYLIFTKEIFDELSKKKDFEFLSRKYNRNGLNNHNYTILGDNCDCLFFHPADCYNQKYKGLRNELDSFTLNPRKKTKHIKYNKKKGKYILKNRKFGFFTFDLLSDMVDNEEVKQILLSENRFGECHINSNSLARSLSETDSNSSYVVGGKIKANDQDYFFHSWVEVDDKNIVLDFNHNIVMNRDKYYKLYGAVAISKTSASEMENVIQTINDDADFNMHPMYFNYFGVEMMRDLKKNEKILKK